MYKTFVVPSFARLAAYVSFPL